jgi:hypothetical protein
MLFSSADMAVVSDQHAREDGLVLARRKRYWTWGCTAVYTRGDLRMVERWRTGEWGA